MADVINLLISPSNIEGIGGRITRMMMMKMMESIKIIIVKRLSG